MLQDLRLRRPLRRRLPDLQHLLDHGRPAGPRVRTAAHARRLAPPDPHRRRRRGGRDRPARGAARHPRRLPGRRRAQRALRKLRDRPADDRPGAEDAHGRRRRSRSASVVTLVSSLVPALRSTRVPPIAAFHAFAPAATRRRRLLYAGARRSCSAPPAWRCCCAASSAAPRAGTAAGLMGGGAVAIVLGVSLFSPRLVPPLAAVAGWPLELLRRLTGRLARENAQRNPRRTAVTAAALMIGLALVTFVTVFAAGLKSSIATVVDDNFAGRPGDPEHGRLLADPADAATAAERVPGVELVATVRSVEAEVVDERLKPRLTGSEPKHRPGGRDPLGEGRAGDCCAGSPTTRSSSTILRRRQRLRARATTSSLLTQPAGGSASRSSACSKPSRPARRAPSSPSG